MFYSVKRESKRRGEELSATARDCRPAGRGGVGRHAHAAGVLFALLLWAGTAQAEEAGFDVLEYVVEGNTVLPAARIEEAVYAHMGEHKAIADVESARTALEKAYHDGGYLTVFVDIPEQEIQGGTVRLRVTEGRVERQRVAGAHYYALGRIKAHSAQLAEGNVPYFPEVQQELAGLNKSGDRRVTPVLRPGRAPGTVEAELKVEDKLPLHASLELNDRYSANTSHTRLSAMVRYDNLWQREHGLLANIQVAPEAPDESKVFMLNYLWPLEQATLAVYGVVSQSDVAALGGTSVLGEGQVAGLRYIRPLRARPGLYHSLTLGVDYKDFAETTLLEGANTGTTPMSYLPFTLGYELSLSGQRASGQMSVNFNTHFEGLGADTAEFSNKRFNAKADYLVMRLDLKGRYALGRDYQLSGRFSAQFSGAPLISNEQFSAGGADSVRGYTESAATGDAGWIAGMELLSPNLAPADAWLREWTMAGFLEGADLRVIDALGGQTNRFKLAATGIGTRFRLGARVNGGIDWGYALRDLGDTRRGDSRLHFRLAAEW